MQGQHKLNLVRNARDTLAFLEQHKKFEKKVKQYLAFLLHFAFICDHRSEWWSIKFVDFNRNYIYNIIELLRPRGEYMDYVTELAAIAKAHGGIIETKIAAQHGISKAMLYKLCKEDKIHRIVKGQYILPDDMQDELLSISKCSENIIFSHETALYLHGISDRTPFEHTVTAPSGCIPSSAIKSECKVYYIKPELFELGLSTLRTPAGNNVPAYDLERTICDVIRSRNKLGTETFLAALKLYAVNPKKDLNKLNAYAKKLRVSNVLRQYLEVLLCAKQ